jgi:hypothetical protein
VIKEKEIELFNLEVDALHLGKPLSLPDDHDLKGAVFGMRAEEIEKTFLSVFNLYRN